MHYPCMKYFYILIFLAFHGISHGTSAEESLSILESNQTLMAKKLEKYDQALDLLYQKIEPPKNLPFPPTHPNMVQINVSDMTVKLATDTAQSTPQVASIIDLTAKSNPEIISQLDISPTKIKEITQKNIKKELIPLSVKSNKPLFLVLFTIFTILVAFLLYFFSLTPKKQNRINHTDIFLELFKNSLSTSIKLKLNGVPDNLRSSLLSSELGRWILNIDNQSDKKHIAKSFAEKIFPTLPIEYQKNINKKLLFDTALTFLADDSAIQQR